MGVGSKIKCIPAALGSTMEVIAMENDSAFEDPLFYIQMGIVLSGGLMESSVYHKVEVYSFHLSSSVMCLP